MNLALFQVLTNPTYKPMAAVYRFVSFLFLAFLLKIIVLESRPVRRRIHKYIVARVTYKYIPRRRRRNRRNRIAVESRSDLGCRHRRAWRKDSSRNRC